MEKAIVSAAKWLAMGMILGGLAFGFGLYKGLSDCGREVRRLGEGIRIPSQHTLRVQMPYGLKIEPLRVHHTPEQSGVPLKLDVAVKLPMPGGN